MKQLYGIDDPKLESQLRKTAAARALRRRKPSFRLLACSIAVGILAALMLGCLGLGGSGYVYPVCVAVVMVIVLEPVQRFLFRRTEDKALRSTLREAGRCEGCGYDLRNTGIQPCPECGHDGQGKVPG